MRADIAWMKAVRKFVAKHKFGSVAELVRQAIDKFMADYQ